MAENKYVFYSKDAHDMRSLDSYGMQSTDSLFVLVKRQLKDLK